MKRVCRCLKQLDLSAKEMRASLASLQSPLNEIISSAAENTDGDAGIFFRSILSELSRLNETRFSEIWRKNDQQYLSILPERDRESLIALGTFLGRFDLEDQLCACDRYIISNEESLSAFESRIPETKRLYLALSGAAGVFLCLLIL